MSDLFDAADGATKKYAKITAADIRAAMAKRWAAPEYAMFHEVGLATGAVARQRWADAVIMSLWPSRGLELHGVEIKVSRSDWKREAADPVKAEAIAKYCDRWWIHTSPGVIQDLSEVPIAWGVREFDGKAWRTIREAEKTAAEPIPRTFLAALLRRADEAHAGIARREAEAALAAERERLAKEREGIRAQIDAAVERRTANLSKAADALREFEAAAGVRIGSAFGSEDPAHVGAIIRAMMAAGLSRYWSGIGQLEQKMRTMADAIGEERAKFCLPGEEAIQ